MCTRRLRPDSNLKDRKIVRERRVYDFTGLLVQIGLLKAKPV